MHENAAGARNVPAPGVFYRQALQRFPEMTPTHAPPRYEFRCWKSGAAETLRKLRDHFEDAGVEERMDTYLIAPADTDLLPKIRGAQAFEIKQRISDGDDRFDLWDARLHEEFPLSAAAVQRIAEILDCAADAPAPLETGRAAIRALAPPLKAYSVPKLRRRFERDGCRAEITHVLISLKPYETVALDCEDPDALESWVNTLGLGHLENVDFGEKLRAVGDPR